MGRFPAVVLAAALFSGVVMGHHLGLPRVVWLAAATALFITGLLGLHAGSGPRWGRLFACASMILLGGFRAASTPAPPWTWVRGFPDRLVEVHGIVSEEPVWSFRYGRRRTILSITWHRGWTEEILVEAPGYVRANPGDRICAWGRLSRPQPPRNPGELSMDRERVLRGVTGILRVDHRGNLALRRGRGFSLVGVKRFIRSAIRIHIPVSQQGFVAAILLGDRHDLEPKAHACMMATGTYHLIAISGFNIALMAGIIWLFLRGLLLPPACRRMAVLAFVGIYPLITGCQPSIVRSSLMIGIAVLGGLLGRRPAPLNILGVTVGIIILMDPLFAYRIGFLLSVGAVFGILAWSGPIQSLGHVRDPLRSRLQDPREVPRAIRAFRRWILPSLGVSLGATLGTAPIIAWTFHRFHPYGPVWNLVVGPPFAIALAGSLGVIIMHPLLPGLASLMGAAVGTTLDLFFAMLGIGLHLPGNTIHLPAVEPIWVAAYYVAILWGGLGWPIPIGRRGAIVLAAALLLGAAWRTTEGMARGPELCVLDLGSNSATLLRLGRRAYLFDAGTGRKDGEIVARALAAWRLRSISAVFLLQEQPGTERSLEHIGHVVRIGRVLLRPGSAVAEIRAGDTIRLDRQWIVQVLHAPLDLPRGIPSSAAAGGLVLRVRGPQGAVLIAANPFGLLLSPKAHVDGIVVHRTRGAPPSGFVPVVEGLKPGWVILSGSGGSATLRALRASGLLARATWQHGALIVGSEGTRFRRPQMPYMRFAIRHSSVQ